MPFKHGCTLRHALFSRHASPPLYTYLRDRINFSFAVCAIRCRRMYVHLRETTPTPKMCFAIKGARQVPLNGTRRKCGTNLRADRRLSLLRPTYHEAESA